MACPLELITNMLPNWLAAIGTIALAWIACSQLKGLNKTLKMNSLMAVLEMEAEMSRKKERYEEAVSARQKMEIEYQQLKDPAENYDGLIGILQASEQSALENYLYSLNRLCYCIKKRYLSDLSDKNGKFKYLGLVSDVVKKHSDSFGPSTRYVDIIDMHNEWIRE